MHGSKRKRGQNYASASQLPPSPKFPIDFAARARKDGSNVKNRWGGAILRLTSGQVRGYSNGKMMYGRDQGLAQVALFNLTQSSVQHTR